MIRIVATQKANIKWVEFHPIDDQKVKQICYTWYPSEFIITKREAKKRIDTFLNNPRYDLDCSSL